MNKSVQGSQDSTPSQTKESGSGNAVSGVDAEKMRNAVESMFERVANKQRTPGAEPAKSRESAPGLKD